MACEAEKRDYKRAWMLATLAKSKLDKAQGRSEIMKVFKQDITPAMKAVRDARLALLRCQVS